MCPEMLTAAVAPPGPGGMMNYNPEAVDVWAMVGGVVQLLKARLYRMVVQNGCTERLYRTVVRNGCTEQLYRTTVNNGC
jgi:hypothetical protein